jgi:hypothetical protein
LTGGCPITEVALQIADVTDCVSGGVCLTHGAQLSVNLFVGLARPFIACAMPVEIGEIPKTVCAMAAYAGPVEHCECFVVESFGNTQTPLLLCQDSKVVGHLTATGMVALTRELAQRLFKAPSRILEASAVPMQQSERV